MCLPIGVWLFECICDYIPVSLGWLWLFTFKLCVCLCPCVLEHMKDFPGCEHSRLLNMSSCVSLPGYLLSSSPVHACLDHSARCQVPPKTASHQQGAPESHAPAFQGPKSRILGG